MTDEAGRHGSPAALSSDRVDPPLPQQNGPALQNGHDCSSVSSPHEAFFIGEDEETALLNKRLSLATTFTAFEPMQSQSSFAPFGGDEQAQSPLSSFQLSTIREQLGTFSEEILGFRKELRNLKTGEAQMRRQLAVLTQERQDSFADVLDGERRERSAAFESLALDVQRSWRAVEEEAKNQSESIGELSSTQDRESKERVALEVSVHQALSEMHADFEEEVRQRSKLTADLKISLAREVTERREKQENMAVSLKETLESVERESNARTEAINTIRTSLFELQAGVDAAGQCLEEETMSFSQALEVESKERGLADDEMKQRFAALRAQLDEALRPFHEDGVRDLSAEMIGVEEASSRIFPFGPLELEHIGSLADTERELRTFKEETAQQLHNLAEAISQERGERERLAIQAGIVRLEQQEWGYRSPPKAPTTSLGPDSPSRAPASQGSPSPTQNRSPGLPDDASSVSSLPEARSVCSGRSAKPNFATALPAGSFVQTFDSSAT